MIYAADYAMTVESIEKNMQARYNALQQGMELLEKRKEIQTKHVTFETIYDVVSDQEYNYGKYEGGNSYVESFELLAIVADTPFDVVLMGNSSDTHQNAFDVYAPKMKESNRKTLENHLMHYLINGGFRDANQGFELRFC